MSRINTNNEELKNLIENVVLSELSEEELEEVAGGALKTSSGYRIKSALLGTAAIVALTASLVNAENVAYDDTLGDVITCTSEDGDKVIRIDKGEFKKRFKNLNFWLSATSGAAAVGLGGASVFNLAEAMGAEKVEKLGQDYVINIKKKD